MKKIFEPIDLQILHFDETDIVTASNGGYKDPNEGPAIPASFIEVFGDFV